MNGQIDAPPRPSGSVKRLRRLRRRPDRPSRSQLFVGRPRRVGEAAALIIQWFLTMPPRHSSSVRRLRRPRRPQTTPANGIFLFVGVPCGVGEKRGGFYHPLVPDSQQQRQAASPPPLQVYHPLVGGGLAQWTYRPGAGHLLSV